MINQNGRPEAVSGRLRRSAVWGASIWGTEGPEFKSRQPDNKNHRSGPVFRDRPSTCYGDNCAFDAHQCLSGEVVQFVLVCTLRFMRGHVRQPRPGQANILMKPGRAYRRSGRSAPHSESTGCNVNRSVAPRLEIAASPHPTAVRSSWPLIEPPRRSPSRLSIDSPFLSPW